MLKKILPSPLRSAERQKTCKGLKDAHLQEEGNSTEFLPEAVIEDVMLHGLGSLPEVRAGSGGSVGENSMQAGGRQEDWLLGSRDSHPQSALKGLERLRNVLQNKNCLPRKGSSLAAWQEAKWLKQKNAKLLPLPRNWKKDPGNDMRPLPRQSGLDFFQMRTLNETQESVMDKCSLILESPREQPAKFRVFLAQHSYDLFDGPNKYPEAELPLTTGEYGLYLLRHG